MTRARDDRGTIIVIVSLLMASIILVAAIVIDLGFLRNSAGVDQSTADLAALAGGSQLSQGNYTAACKDVVNYLNVNLDTSIDATNFCTSASNDMGATTCSGGSTAQAAPTATAGKYTVSVHFPVPNSEIADSHVTGGSYANDGTPCQRMRVIITSTESGFFGQFSRSAYTATRTATVRSTTGGQKSVPALWLLDPTDCTSLTITGGSQVTVGRPSPGVPGIVAIDSDGTGCGGQNTTVTISGGNSKLRAVPTTGTPKGDIKLFALAPNATVCSGHACDPGAVSSGQIAPQPTGAGERATRAPVDWRYNCKSTYPNYHGIAIEGCSDSTPSYIDNLRAAIGPSGAPAGFQRWSSTYSCSPGNTVVPPGQNWWVDCSNGLNVGGGASVTFQGGNVVFDKTVTVSGGGSLKFNDANPSSLPATCLPPTVVTPCIGQSSPNAAFVYVRSGDINVSGGSGFSANHTAIYEATGHVEISGGSPPIWTAPTEGPLANLALWAEQSTSKFQVTGGSGVNLQGVFFTPEAKPFTLSGGGDWGQENAQFISYHLEITGGSTLTMSPSETFVAEQPKGGALIR